jgi:hypothetical protein
VNGSDDPGWGVPLRSLAWRAVPFVGLLVARRSRKRQDSLTALRTVLLAESASLLLFWIAFSFIADWDGGDEGRVPWAVLGFGCLAMVGIAWVRRRPLVGTNPAALVGAYRTQFFIS